MWSSSYSGQVNINVTGVNSCGNGTVSDNLAVMVNPIPSKANTPTGANTLCQNSSGKSYSIVGSTYALSYQWNLMPEEAGMISGSSTTASVTWANGFTGTANIKVLGVNNCGTGLYSDVIAVTINPLPLKADMPSGPTSLCQNPSNQNYTVNQTTNATSYEWVLGPDACGIISGTGATSSLNMDNNFTGNATLKVRGINTCGAGAYCDPLTVIVNSFPDKPSTPSGRTNLCQGEPLTKYTSLSSNAVSYNWSIDPATSANLQPLKDSVFVSWKSNYAGTAYLSVSAVNGCGSITSDLKPITVNAKPIAPSKPGVVDYCKNQKVILVSSNVSCDNILWYDLSRNYLFTGNTNTIETLREGKAFKVVAKNAIGCISDSTTILANIQDVKADFTADYMSILKGSKVTFSDNSKNAATTSWVFGDGFTSTQKSPFHFFNNAGSFDIKLIVSSAINCQDTLVKKNYIVVSGATGISTETALGMKVYPIPARDVIYVDTKQYTKENDILLKLYSINGEELVTKKLLPGTINEVDIHTLCAGTYLINITVNGVISSTKILKSN